MGWNRTACGPWKKSSCRWKCPSYIHIYCCISWEMNYLSWDGWTLGWVSPLMSLPSTWSSAFDRSAAYCLVGKRRCSFWVELVINNQLACVLLHLLPCLFGIFLSEENMFWLLLQAVVDHMTRLSPLQDCSPSFSTQCKPARRQIILQTCNFLHALVQQPSFYLICSRAWQHWIIEVCTRYHLTKVLVSSCVNKRECQFPHWQPIYLSLLTCFSLET